ncbi:MAG: DUF3231 family protein [Chitinophagales bacterium]
MPSVIDQLLGTQSTAQQQKGLVAGEVYAMWSGLASRYDYRQLVDIFQIFANDVDLKALLTVGLGIIDSEISQMEKELMTHGIPMPTRPPTALTTPVNTEVMQDEHIYRISLATLQAMIETGIRSLRAVRLPRWREMLLKFEEEDSSHLLAFADYGQVKGWIRIPPDYKPSIG